MKALNSFVSITFLILALTLIGSAPAAAARYEWRSASSGGNWASAANWTVVEGPAGVGYPNQAGDVADERFRPGVQTIDFLDRVDSELGAWE